MNKIEAVIFDMDGVIFDTERFYLNIWIQVFEKYGYKMTKDIYIPVMGSGRKNAIETFLKIYGQDLPIKQMYKEKDNKLEQAVKAGQIPMKPGVKEILSYLKCKKCRIALATSAKKERALIQLNNANLISEFDTIITGDDILNHKPNPDIFLKAAKELFVKPENCIVIEDSPAGIKAAYNANMIAIHIEDLKKADNEILECCHSNFMNMFEVKEYINKTFFGTEVNKNAF